MAATGRRSPVGADVDHPHPCTPLPRKGRVQTSRETSEWAVPRVLPQDVTDFTGLVEMLPTATFERFQNRLPELGLRP